MIEPFYLTPSRWSTYVIPGSDDKDNADGKEASAQESPTPSSRGAWEAASSTDWLIPSRPTQRQVDYLTLLAERLGRDA